jgi:hypothetical protein
MPSKVVCRVMYRHFHVIFLVLLKGLGVGCWWLPAVCVRQSRPTGTGW